MSIPNPKEFQVREMTGQDELNRQVVEFFAKNMSRGEKKFRGVVNHEKGSLHIAARNIKEHLREAGWEDNAWQVTTQEVPYRIIRVRLRSRFRDSRFAKMSKDSRRRDKNMASSIDGNRCRIL